MTHVRLAVIYAYFTTPGGYARFRRAGRETSAYRSFAIIRPILLVVAAVPIAILTNALRVSGTGVLAHYYGTRAADGFFHSFSGWVIYIVAALLLFATGWLIDRLAGFMTKDRLVRLEAGYRRLSSGK